MYNLITLNINGLNDPTKRTALIDWLKCMKADIVCLQETHAPSHSSIQSWFRNSGFYVASSVTVVPMRKLSNISFLSVDTPVSWLAGYISTS